VKRIIRRKIQAEKRKIARRLENAVQVKFAGPVLSATNIHYELADRTNAIAHGGIDAVHRLVNKLGLAERVNAALHLLKVHVPYYESDHVLNLAYNGLCGGRTLDDIEVRRNDRNYLDALGTTSIPDPTTAGDFCRRFTAGNVELLMGAINETRLEVWKRHPTLTRETARIDADGTLVTTLGECKEGMDIDHAGKWGYSTLQVLLANTAEPLFLCNRSGNRPSHEGVIGYFDKSIALCRRAGFADILLRGDTDFSLTAAFDRWSDDKVRFIFGNDANDTMKAWAGSAPDDMYQELVREAERIIKTKARERPENVKQRIVVERGFEDIRLKGEEVIDFDYRPRKCKRTYRVVAVRKNLSHERHELVLFEEVRYFFYITNDFTLSNEQVVKKANQRCNQENLIQQLKDGVRALHAPVNTLNADWAYMVMASPGWSLKAWIALTLSIHARWRERHVEEQRQLLRMELRTFLAAFINVPCQILRTSRRLVYRLLAWNLWQHVFFRFAIRPEQRRQPAAEEEAGERAVNQLCAKIRMRERRPLRRASLPG
jgi:hypothetical protein